MVDNLSNDAKKMLLLRYKNLIDTNNKGFFPLFFDKHRYLVLKGGGGSGKSIFAGRKVLERCIYEEGHKILVCRKVGKTIRDSCFAQLKAQLGDYYSGKKYVVNKSSMEIIFPDNNSKIIFSGLDDVEKLKSIHGITGIWIEEASELLEGDFNQLDIRLRGETKYYKQIILSFNPINILHWLKKRFFDFNDPNACIHQSTYKDNRFLDDAAIKVLEDFKNTDQYYYDVYCLGHWGVTGKSVFDARKLSARLEHLPDPIITGDFKYDYDGLFINDATINCYADGMTTIYKKPESGHTYVIGVDTAGDGSDSAVAQVLDAYSMDQVAILRSADVAEDIVTRQVYCLGMYYNQALIGIETNYSTYPVRELQRLRYPHQYVRQVFDDATQSIQLKYGFITNTKSRAAIISNLVRFVRECTDCINSKVTIAEMLTFIRNPDTYKPEAEEGGHDDTVMAMAIACHIRDSGQVNISAPAAPVAKTDWTRDMFDDYRSAKPDERKMMLKKWGHPKVWH